MIYSKFSDNQTFIYERLRHPDQAGYVLGDCHYHNLYEIYYMESGECNYFIDNKSYHMTPGDIVLIPEGIIHNTLYPGEQTCRSLINCSKKYIPASVLSLFSKRQYLYRNPDIKDTLLEMLNKIGEEYSKDDTFSNEVLRCYISLFFFTIARNKNCYIDSESHSGYIEEAINYVQNNLSSDISLRDIAERFSVSQEHFSRQFKKETGFGFCEYLNLLRLKKAETLLKQNDKLSIAHIADECGFNDSNYFSVKFKNMYGISPKSFRKQMI